MRKFNPGRTTGVVAVWATVKLVLSDHVRANLIWLPPRKVNASGLLTLKPLYEFLFLHEKHISFVLT